MALTLQQTTKRTGLQYLLLLASAVGIASMFYFSKSNNTSNHNNDEPAPAINFMGAGNEPLAVTDVVTAAQNFYNSLSTTQQATLQMTYTTSLARKWSNLPCGTSCRNGIQLGTNLTTAQYNFAQTLIKAALSTTGYEEFHQLNLAEAYLHANGGGSNYDSVLRWIAFLNAPTSTGSWMLQFGGHHYAANIAFNNGHVVGATPFFVALEPKTFTYNSVAYDPLGEERDAIRTALASLSSTQLTSATLSSSFSDCVMVPGETNGGTSTFPAYTQGIAVSSLSTAQKALVLAAIKTYVEDMDATTSAAIMTDYENALDQTYISYRGTGTAGTASTFFNVQGDYARISGPRVWIEFSCQSGVVVSSQIHYHSIWRDRVHDYGVDLTGDPIDATTGVNTYAKSVKANIYPNPATSKIAVKLPTSINKGQVLVSDMTGKTVLTLNEVSGSEISLNIANLATGNYLLKLVDNSNHNYYGTFVKK